jgi:hypothetical protein
MTVSDLLEQPCNKSDNAIKFVPNLLQQLGTQIVDNIVNTQYKTLNNNVTVTKSNKCLKNSLIIHEENTKKNHKRVVSVYVIQIQVDLHKL